MILALLFGCAQPEEMDTACADAPPLAWADVGEPLLIEHCDTCHAATSPDRRGAPENVVFDTYDQVVTLRVSMLAALEGDPPRMPPLISVPEEDREMLLSWLRCDVGQ